MLTADPKNRDGLAAAALAAKLQNLLNAAAKSGNPEVIAAMETVVETLSHTIAGLPEMMREIITDHNKKTATLRKAKPIGKVS